MKTIIRIIAISLMVLLLPGVAMAQGNGGKKKPKLPTPVNPTPSKPTSGMINGHEWVDLGLTVKWATCNVGASSPSEYGSYFAWGETSPKSDYSYSTSKTYIKSIGNISGNPDYDAARANWKGSWRMPTKAECEELVSKCKWTRTTIRGKKGYRVMGPNGNSIFLPAAGRRDGSSLDTGGLYGYYWSSTPDESKVEYAYRLWFGDSSHCVDWGYRCRGRSIRPVLE